MTDKTLSEQVDQVEQQTDADQETGEKGRVFTQEEVNRIIADRIKRTREKAEKEHAKALEDLNAELSQGIDSKSADLNKREKLLSCREYLINNDYPVSLLEIIDTDNVENFKAKADMIRNEFAKARQVPPLKSTENHNHPDGIKQAFADPKHVPKKF